MDRREEVIEVEEQPETVHLDVVNEDAQLMTQGQWMKGCPEGGEQGFLFSLYSQLSEGECFCPHGCGYSITRKKSDFFAIYVSTWLWISLQAKLSSLREVLFPDVHPTVAQCYSSRMQAVPQRILFRMWRTLQSDKGTDYRYR